MERRKGKRDKNYKGNKMNEYTTNQPIGSTQSNEPIFSTGANPPAHQGSKWEIYTTSNRPHGWRKGQYFQGLHWYMGYQKTNDEIEDMEDWEFNRLEAEYLLTLKDNK